MTDDERLLAGLMTEHEELRERVANMGPAEFERYCRHEAALAKARARTEKLTKPKRGRMDAEEKRIRAMSDKDLDAEFRRVASGVEPPQRDATETRVRKLSNGNFDKFVREYAKGQGHGR